LGGSGFGVTRALAKCCTVSLFFEGPRRARLTIRQAELAVLSQLEVQNRNMDDRPHEQTFPSLEACGSSAQPPGWTKTRVLADNFVPLKTFPLKTFPRCPLCLSDNRTSAAAPEEQP
jgi:hypothetical protein